MGGPPHGPPPPRPCRAPACHSLSPACPPGVYSGRGGCRAAAGVSRGPVGRQWVSAAGGGGGNPPALVCAPVFCRPASEGRSVCAVLGAASLPSDGSGQGGSVRAVHRGRLPRPRCPLTPGAAASSGGGAGPLSLRSASIRSWA